MDYEIATHKNIIYVTSSIGKIEDMLDTKMARFASKKYNAGFFLENSKFVFCALGEEKY